MATQTKGKVGGDVVLELFSKFHCLDDITITNGAAYVMELEAGYPMDANVPVVATGEAGTDGILIQPVSIPVSGTARVPVLLRGPATLNKNAMPTSDHAGVAFTMATIWTALEALDNIVLKAEPVTTEEQTK
jgi:hypothetical protein